MNPFIHVKKIKEHIKDISFDVIAQDSVERELFGFLSALTDELAFLKELKVKHEQNLNTFAEVLKDTLKEHLEVSLELIFNLIEKMPPRISIVDERIKLLEAAIEEGEKS